MTTNSAASASQRHVETAAAMHVYRHLGKADGTPWACLHQGTGTLDHWNPHGGSASDDACHRLGDR